MTEILITITVINLIMLGINMAHFMEVKKQLGVLSRRSKAHEDYLKSIEYVLIDYTKGQ